MTIKKHAPHIQFSDVFPQIDKKLGVTRLTANMTFFVAVNAIESTRTDHNAGRYSSRCTWKKVKHRITYAMSFRISGRTLIFQHDIHEKRLTLPIGWK